MQLKKFSLSAMSFGAIFYWLSFYLLDQPIANAFHNISHSSTFFSICKFLTILGSAKFTITFTFIGLIFGIVILIKKPQSRLGNNLLLIAIAMLAVILSECILKYLLGRYRPELFFTEGLYGFHFLTNEFLMNSSPSGHAARAFVFVTGCSLVFKRLTPLFILLGMGVCLSRLVLEFHFLSDVVFGALLGSLITLWVGKIYYSMTLSHSTLAPFKLR